MQLHELQVIWWTGCESSGSHGREYEDDCLVGRCAVMIEALTTSETSVSFYQTSRRSIPDDSRLHSRHNKNLKRRIVRTRLFRLKTFKTSM
jgi:hypothetical protein